MSYFPELIFAFFAGSLLFVAGYDIQRQPEFELPHYIYKLGVFGDVLVNLSTIAAGLAAIASMYWGVINSSTINTAAHWLGSTVLFGVIHGALKSASRNFYDVYFMGTGLLIGFVLVILSQILLWS